MLFCNVDDLVGDGGRREMTIVRFTVPGNPVPQSRPRFTKQGRAYDTKACKIYKRQVAIAAKAAMGTQEPLRGAIKCIMIFYMPIPKSLSQKRRRELIGEFVTKRTGDIDNLSKIIMDSVPGIVYVDDAQVAVIHASKVYDDKPRVEVEFEEC